MLQRHLASWLLLGCSTAALGQHVVLSPSDIAAVLHQPAPARKIGMRVRSQVTPPAIDLRDPAVRKRIAEGLLGSGFNIWTNHVVPNRCAVFPASYMVFKPAVPGVPSSSSWSEIDYVTSFSQHVNNQSFKIGATITYNGFSLGGSHADASSNQFSSYSSYIDVNKGVVGDTDELLKPQGATLEIAPSNLAIQAVTHNTDGHFSKLCGQAYVSKVEFGEKISGTMNYAVSLDGSTKTNSNSVSVGVKGILGGSASGGSSSASLSQVAAISYHVQGGPAEDPDPDHWLPLIRNYGKDGKFAESNEVVFVETTPYSTMAHSAFSNFTDPADLAQGSMTTLTAEFTQNLQLLKDTLDAQSHPDVFTTPTPDYPDRIKALSQFLDDAGVVYHECERAITPALAQQCAKDAKAVTRPPFYPPLVLK